MSKCSEPDPDNDRLAAFYFPGGGSGTPGVSNQAPGLFCELPVGHAGYHQCYRAWRSYHGCGEIVMWGMAESEGT